MPEPTPPAYSATFALSIDGAEMFLLQAFGGCTDEVLAMRYQDCYFATHAPSRALFQWLDDTVRSRGRRDLMVYQFDDVGQVVSETRVDNAFLREFDISPLDASASDAVMFTFVAVPDAITTKAGGSGSLPNASFLRSNWFRVNIGGVDGSFVATVEGLRLKVEKLPAPPDRGRQLFTPGNISTSALVLQVAEFGVTAADLDAWIAQQSTGTPAPRSGVVEFTNQSGTTVLATLKFTEIVPQTFPAFPTGARRRLFTAQIQPFTLQ